jgi:hypothetical protein
MERHLSRSSKLKGTEDKSELGLDAVADDAYSNASSR